MLLFFSFDTTPQSTVTRDGQEVELRGKGRHDPCVLPRAVPMVEAMVALTLVDHIMMQQAQCNLFENNMPLEQQPNPMGSTVQGRGTSKIGTVEDRITEHHHGAATATTASGPVSQRIDEE
jgi:hypothetical protein